ncbi:MAG: twin-arginine translocase TatA/TatE family subunit [Solirubrobacteraceae bacterium]
MVGDILQPTHLLFILVVALLVLGPKRLPEVGRQLGNGLRDFRAAINGERSERHEEVYAPPVGATATAAPAAEHPYVPPATPEAASDPAMDADYSPPPTDAEHMPVPPTDAEHTPVPPTDPEHTPAPPADTESTHVPATAGTTPVAPPLEEPADEAPKPPAEPRSRPAG